MSNDSKEIILAVVSNPSFFDPKELPDTKLQLVSDLIKKVEEVTK